MACIAVKGWALTSAACITFFTLTSACLADEGAKVRRNRTLRERWIAVARRIVSAKYKAYFHFRSIKSYSIILLFRYSVFHVIQRPVLCCLVRAHALIYIFITYTFLHGNTVAMSDNPYVVPIHYRITMLLPEPQPTHRLSLSCFSWLLDSSVHCMNSENPVDCAGEESVD